MGTQMSEFLKKSIFILALLITSAVFSFAQGGPGGIDPGDENPDNGVPLDGGVSLLIAGGVSYVAVKMRKQHLKRKAAEEGLDK